MLSWLSRGKRVWLGHPSWPYAFTFPQKCPTSHYDSSQFFSDGSKLHCWCIMGPAHLVRLIESWNELQNTKLRTLRTLNVRTSNFPNITFWPKIELQTCQTSQKIEQLMNIKLYVPRLVWSHNKRTEIRILLNITFWPKTEHQTCQTSQKIEQFVSIELFIPRLNSAILVYLMAFSYCRYYFPIYSSLWWYGGWCQCVLGQTKKKPRTSTMENETRPIWVTSDTLWEKDSTSISSLV